MSNTPFGSNIGSNSYSISTMSGLSSDQSGRVANVSSGAGDDTQSPNVSGNGVTTSTTTINTTGGWVFLGYGVYGYQISLNSDLIDSSATTSQGEFAEGDAHSQMVFEISGYTGS